MPKRKPAETAATPEETHITSDVMRTGVALLALAVAMVIVFYPLTQFFFAQDDFTLLLRGIDGGSGSLLNTLKPQPGQFRPLSKILYFQTMYRWFGLNPFPYHLVSLFLHIINTFLFFVLVRTFRLRLAGALLVTFLFGLSTAFTNIVAWISCIQQLLGQFFGLLTLIAGIAAIERRSRKFSIAATAAFLLGIGSIEQIAGIPLILALYAFSLERNGNRSERMTRAVRRTALPLAAMLLYVIFMLIWKRLPGAGPYTLHFGGNILDNLLVYLHWTYAFSIQIPFLINNLRSGLTTAHLVVLAVVLFNLARGRASMVLIAAAYYLITILPVLPLENHTFFTHTYIPAFGMLLLLGYLIEEFFALIETWEKRNAFWYRGIFFLLIPVISFIQIDKSINTPMREDYQLPRNYVLRRAVIAKTAYDDIMPRKMPLPPGGKFYMVFMGEQSWYSSNVLASLGHGDAIKLFYDDPRLQVFANVKGDTLDGFSAETSQILFYDYLGNFFTNSEIAEKQGSAIGEITR